MTRKTYRRSWPMHAAMASRKRLRQWQSSVALDGALLTYAGLRNGAGQPQGHTSSLRVAATMQLSLSGTASGTLVIYATHGLTLVPGWNLVSFNLHPTNTDIAAVLASLGTNYDLVYAWDATGGHSSGGNWMKYARGVRVWRYAAHPRREGGLLDPRHSVEQRHAQRRGQHPDDDEH